MKSRVIALCTLVASCVATASSDGGSDLGADAGTDAGVRADAGESAVDAGPPVTSTTLTGTVGGVSLTISDSISSSVSISLGIAIGSEANLCALANANETPKSSNMLGFVLAETDATGTPIAPRAGTYIVTTPGSGISTGAAQVANVVFQTYDSSCQATSTAALDGTVTLLTAPAGTGTSATGRFQLAFPGMDQLSGTFDAAFCDIKSASGANTCN